MTEKIISKIDHSEIQELKERLEKLERELEKEIAPEAKKEMVKQEIKNYLQELQQTPSFAPPPASRDEVKEIEKLEKNQQIGALISLVFEKGLEKAVSLARALDNPAVLDEFHDTLVDKYYQMLLEKGILKI